MATAPQYIQKRASTASRGGGLKRPFLRRRRVRAGRRQKYSASAGTAPQSMVKR